MNAKKFVVRPSGGSLYLAFSLNYELPPEGRTTNIAFSDSMALLLSPIGNFATRRHVIDVIHLVTV